MVFQLYKLSKINFNTVNNDTFNSVRNISAKQLKNIVVNADFIYRKKSIIFSIIKDNVFYKVK